MAALTTMTLIGLGMAVGGQVINAIGNKKAGDAAKAAGESAAQQQEFNAQVAELQAADALARGQDEESRFRSSVRGLIGSQRAGFAGQGVEVGAGSAADVQADTAFLAEQDVQNIRANAAREAWGFQVEAQDRRMAADVARKGGQATASAAKWNTASSVLGAGSSLVMQRYGWSR